MPNARTSGRLAKLDSVNRQIAAVRAQGHELEARRNRIVAELVEIDGMSQRAVARHQDMSPSAVAWMLAHAAANGHG